MPSLHRPYVFAFRLHIRTLHFEVLDDRLVREERSFAFCPSTAYRIPVAPMVATPAASKRPRLLETPLETLYLCNIFCEQLRRRFRLVRLCVVVA